MFQQVQIYFDTKTEASLRDCHTEYLSKKQFLEY